MNTFTIRKANPLNKKKKRLQSVVNVSLPWIQLFLLPMLFRIACNTDHPGPSFLVNGPGSISQIPTHTAPCFCFYKWPIYTYAKVSPSRTCSVGQTFKSFHGLIQKNRLSILCNMPEEGSSPRSFSLYPAKENILDLIFRERKRQRQTPGECTGRSCCLRVPTCRLAWCHLVALLIPVCSLIQGMGVSFDPTIISLCGSGSMRNFIKPWQP